MDRASFGGLVPGGGDLGRKLLNLGGILLAGRFDKILGKDPDLALRRAISQPMPLGLPRRFDRTGMTARL